MKWIMSKLIKEVKKHNTNNPFVIAENRNIIVNYFPLGNTLGFYMKNSRHQIITLNSSIDDYLLKFVCAHELGHAILHPNENTPFLHKNTLISKDKIEKEANYWATKLLLFDVDVSAFETKYQLLTSLGIPSEMGRFIN